MILTTTQGVEGRPVESYHGIVTGQAIAEEIWDFESEGKEHVDKARKSALDDLAKAASEKGADAVVAVELDYVVLSDDTLMVTASGTAVKLG